MMTTDETLIDTNGIVFSGVQPTGDLHLGNYLGAIEQFIPLQETRPCFFCVVDLHAITVKHDPAQLRHNVYAITAAYLASGIDPEKAVIFNQSRVPAHAEMAWLLSCVARMGYLERMTQYKDKNRENKERSSVGLFTYPILMAADILTYGASSVPVGDDQRQHLELARVIAEKFNKEYGGSLKIPQAMTSKASRIMSLTDASSKMSKSDPDAKSRINLTDTDDVIVKKIKKAVADTQPFPPVLTILDRPVILKPEVANLIAIYRAVTGESDEQIVSKFGGQGYGVFKPALADAVIAKVAPIRDRMTELMADPAQLEAVLELGAARANHVAVVMLDHVKEKMGLI